MQPCGVSWVENLKKESTSKILLVCLPLGKGQARSCKHKKLIYLLRSRIICRFVNSNCIYSTKSVPWMWRYMYICVFWSQCWFNNFLPSTAVFNFICFINGVVDCKLNNKFMWMVKNPRPLISQKFGAPNNEMRIKSQNHKNLKTGKNSKIIDCKRYVKLDCNLLLMISLIYYW